jgi:hypothetical protein
MAADHDRFKAIHRRPSMPAAFDDIEIGQVVSLGVARRPGKALEPSSPPSRPAGRSRAARPTP